MASKKKDIVSIIIDAIEEKKGYDIRVIDVNELTIAADRFVICSSDSTSQSRAIADCVLDRLDEAGMHISYSEGYKTGEWVVINALGAMVHIFLPEVRQHFGLEDLWSEEASHMREEAERVSAEITRRFVRQRETRKEQPPAPKAKATGPSSRTAKAKAAPAAAKTKKRTGPPSIDELRETASRTKKSMKELIEEEIRKGAGKAKAPARELPGSSAPGKGRKASIEAEIAAARAKKEAAKAALPQKKDAKKAGKKK